MKWTLRSDCFETNSSSMHSIVITKNDKIVTKDELEKDLFFNKIDIMSESDLRFVRYPFRILSSVEDKIAYIIASYCGGYKSREEKEQFMEELEDILKEKCSGCEGVELPKAAHRVYVDSDGNEIYYEDVHHGRKFEHCFRDENGEEKEAHLTDSISEHPVYGYVDHQSFGLLQNFLRDKGVSLKDFLFNKKYLVVIDGDEYCEFEKLIDCGLVSKDNILENYPFSDENEEED